MHRVCIPIFSMLTFDFVFSISQGSKKLVSLRYGGGCMVAICSPSPSTFTSITLSGYPHSPQERREWAAPAAEEITWPARSLPVMPASAATPSNIRQVSLGAGLTYVFSPADYVHWPGFYCGPEKQQTSTIRWGWSQCYFLVVRELLFTGRCVAATASTYRRVLCFY